MSGLLRVLKFPGKRVSYPDALILQKTLLDQKLQNRSTEPDYLIILEHEPCVTLGRRCHTDSEVIKSNYPIFKSPRGGKVTFHGPGQLTCYPIIDLKRQPKLSLECYVQNLAHVMKESLSKSYNLNGLYYDDRPEFVGLWLPQNKKIGFIGIQAQKWITSHGFSINLTKECLKGFQEIDPCGLLNQRIAVTCAENESTKIIDNIEYVLEETFLNTFKLHKAHMNQYK